MALQKQFTISNIFIQTEPKFDENLMFYQSKKKKKIRNTHNQDILRTGNFNN